MTSEPGTRELATTCWCGGALGPAIGWHYRCCLACGTAVLAVQLDPRHFEVADDDRDFYGRAYWTEYADVRGFPAITERARSDLSERCVFWLERLIEVTHPPGRALEIGCVHGGFVRLLQELGFEAMGTELSPWVVDFAKRTFGVPVLPGRLEELALSPGFKCIAAFDVLEHLKDPLDTARRCADLLAPDGVLLLQTPCYRGEGPEWSMFQEDEHVHLFTEESVRLLLDRAGFKDMRVERSLFPYDMWVAASLGSLPAPNPPGGAEGDWRPPAAVRALLDISADVRQTREALRQTAEALRQTAEALRQTAEALRQTAADSEARLAQVDEVTRLLHEADEDRGARLAQVDELSGLLRGAEADRAARHEQVQELSRLLQDSEADRAARFAQIETLTDALRESEADRAARGEVIDALERALNAIEQTRVWRLYTAIASRVNPRGRP